MGDLPLAPPLIWYGTQCSKVQFSLSLQKIGDGCSPLPWNNHSPLFVFVFVVFSVFLFCFVLFCFVFFCFFVFVFVMFCFVFYLCFDLFFVLFCFCFLFLFCLVCLLFVRCCCFCCFCFVFGFLLFLFLFVVFFSFVCLFVLICFFLFCFVLFFVFVLFCLSFALFLLNNSDTAPPPRPTLSRIFWIIVDLFTILFCRGIVGLKREQIATVFCPFTSLSNIQSHNAREKNNQLIKMIFMQMTLTFYINNTRLLSVTALCVHYKLLIYFVALYTCVKTQRNTGNLQRYLHFITEIHVTLRRVSAPSG